MININPIETLETITAIAREAGSMARDAFNNPRETNTKSSGVDLVTDTDKRVEAYIVENLTGHFPDFSLVGEEGGEYNPGSSYRWFIDPIDGTTNFAHGIPHFTVNIALGGSTLFPPVLGVIYDPMRDECFSAIRDEGATLNGKPMKVSSTPTLAQSVVASGFPYTKWSDPDNNVEQWGNLVIRSRGVRRMGAAGLDMVYVAAGRFDGYWEHNLNMWDIMPSIICLLEAGGQVTTYTGEPMDPHKISQLRIVASNGHIHDELLTILRDGKDAPRPNV
jgi:myo-inositol-1(or 4)-monophosphatase